MVSNTVRCKMQKHAVELSSVTLLNLSNKHLNQHRHLNKFKVSEYKPTLGVCAPQQTIHSCDFVANKL
jgi:hypothetical protein